MKGLETSIEKLAKVINHNNVAHEFAGTLASNEEWINTSVASLFGKNSMTADLFNKSEQSTEILAQLLDGRFDSEAWFSMPINYDDIVSEALGDYDREYFKKVDTGVFFYHLASNVATRLRDTGFSSNHVYSKIRDLIVSGELDEKLEVLEPIKKYIVSDWDKMESQMMFLIIWEMSALRHVLVWAYNIQNQKCAES